MIRTAYLRVYQPLESFRPEEQDWFLSQSDDLASEAGMSPSWLVTPTLTALESASEGAFLRRQGSLTFVCPWRVKLRVLSGLLAFRGSVPEEIADAFVSETSARTAARELAALGEGDPDIRSHILHTNWHVPLRWFAAFDGLDRILIEDRNGLRIRYETTLPMAKARLARALAVLEESGIDEDVEEAVRRLAEWLEQFEGEGLLELDYGTVAASFTEEDLVEDRSAADVWACLQALEEGDLVTTGRIFTTLGDRWGRVRAHELVN
jgi:hypothetical protein